MDLDLDLATVRAFVAVADDRYFGEAAVRLGISQQAVSKRVARLEAELGVELLRRERGGVELTEDGAAFLGNARALLGLADQAVGLLRVPRRNLRVDVLSTRIGTLDIIREFLESRPDLEIDIVTSNGLRSARPAVLRGTVDAFVGRALGPPSDGIVHTPAYTEPHYVLAGRRHPFAGRVAVPAAELRGATVWIPGAADTESEWADYYRHFEADLGIRVDSSGPNYGLDHIVETVAASDDRFSVVGTRMRVPWNPDVVQIPIVDPVPVFPFLLQWNRANRHPVLPLFVASVRERFEPHDPRTQWMPDPDRAAFTRPPEPEEDALTRA